MRDNRDHCRERDSDEETRPVADQIAEAAEDAEQVGEAELLRSLRHYKTLSENLERVLSDRVVVEQAKGVLSERHQIGMAEADYVLRSYALRHGMEVADAAREITRGPHLGQ